MRVLLGDRASSFETDAPRLARWCAQRRAAVLWGQVLSRGSNMSERFERHRQPWRQDEIQKLHTLAGRGMSLRAIAKALTRSEESVKDRAKLDRVKIAKLR
jgi:hypothetical protein